jgi:hypothetical protein
MIKKVLKIILVVALIGGVFWLYKNPNAINYFSPKPCSQPIQYSIGSVDPRFNLSVADFTSDVNAATQIWEDGSHKDLFQYNPNSAFKIYLVYDYRQEATDKLKSLGITIDDSKSSYDTLKQNYDSMIVQYNTQKANLSAESSSYNTKVASYNQTVAYWNAQGGASGQTANELKAEHDSLQVQANKINADQTVLNSLVDNINGVANTLNRLARELNLNVQNYNSVGQSRGQEFEEGVYQSDSSGKEIDIYEFDNQQKLIRVLAHEFGHSLGLSHVLNPEAIMYYLNQSKNEKLTPDDIQELDRVCKFSS